MSECNGIVFYRSFYEAVKNLPPEEYKKAVSAILEYGLNGVEPENSGGIEWMVYTLTKPQIDANQKRRENGSKGGKFVSDSKQNEATFKQTEANSKQIEANNKQIEAKVKDKVKDKAKEKVKDKDNMSYGTSANHSDLQDKSCKSDNDQAYAYAEIVDYLNQATGASFRHQSKDTRRLIKKWLKEKFTVEDFKTVIDKKVREWGKAPAPGSKDMRPYLRPSTLFGPKFEIYLEQPDTPNDTAGTYQHNSYDLDAFERNLDKVPTL